jgi:hypothetical protein
MSENAQLSAVLRFGRCRFSTHEGSQQDTTGLVSAASRPTTPGRAACRGSGSRVCGRLLWHERRRRVGGYYGMSGAAGVPTDWLDRGPFDDYFIPGLILFTVVGGSCLVAALASFAGHPSARRLAQIAAAAVFGFIAVEVAIIGSPFWLQPVTAVAAALVVSLARLLPPSARQASAAAAPPDRL